MTREDWEKLADKAANACEASFSDPRKISAALELIVQVNNNCPSGVSSSERKMWSQNEDRWRKASTTGHIPV
jgi:hypothetical protein